ncbi:hypothetical protein DL240_00930 [Lujinxingia litoralis]|uniref:Zinc-ribbon domain-containing protein n=1 Tax=Lujinxingia litoralis TaxID=2211119 RepID=A0A328CAU5_9DELT|nr:zinc ribbon domain-containing protein [Lujinxingia litoralis]RAL24806.1 hypothetical protein DL240_00930 [Lujinxingia litoralis]
MSLPLLIVAIAFTLWGLINMVRPFLARQDEQLRFEVLDEELREIEGLMARKASLVQSLRDIEYDHQTAKISADDYKRFKRSHERQAVAIMRRLDAIHGGREWDDHIEEAIHTRVQALPEADAQDVPSSSTQTAAKSAEACRECGEALSPRARFCAICGTPRTEPDVPAHRAAPLTSEVTG